MSYNLLAELADIQDSLREQRMHLEGLISDHEVAMLAALCAEYNKANPDHEDGPRNHEDLIVTYNWKCADGEGGDRLKPEEISPIGYCVYDQRTDPGDCDECIFCGHPDERK